MNVQAKIKKWGNSLALRLSGPMVSIPHFKENMDVDVNITEEGILIKPAINKSKKNLPFSEENLIDGLTPRRAHADEIISLSTKELGE